MNQATIRTFVRQMITEAKKEVKMKKEEIYANKKRPQKCL